MITCVYCGNTIGPWVRLPEGFACENCLEEVEEKIEKNLNNYLKGNKKNDL